MNTLLTLLTAFPIAFLAAIGTRADAADTPGAANYTEDFSIADRFRRDSVTESGLKVFPKLGLSSTGPQGGEVLYDLQKLLPGWTKDSIVILTYQGGGGDVGKQMIGVHCDGGPSADQLAEFSKAAYGKPVVVRGRYLRFRIAWQQTAGPEYGYLKSFTVRFGTLADVPIPVAFTLDKPGVVTLVIDDAQGNRVRNLISETPFAAGRHVVEWDGCDDHQSKQVHQQPVFTFKGDPVGPGRYTVRGIVRDPVQMRYEMPLYTGGNPAWDTTDGRGGWLQDYTPPTAVVGLSDKMLVGSPVGEAFGIVWTDLEGRRVGGLRGVSGGGGWAGAELLARDNGKRADASVSAYVANNFGKTFEIEALTQQPTVGAYNGGVRTMSMCVWGAGRKVYRPDEGSVTGLAVHNLTVVAAIGNKNKLLVIQDKNIPGFGLRYGDPTVPDKHSGAKIAEVSVKEPRGLAVTPDGKNLLAISGKSIVRFPFPPAGEPAVVVSEGLNEPSQLTLDKDGNIFVSDKGTHQVKVFTSEGKPLRTIGKAGGPQLGSYDEQRMANPAGIAISADNKLWVAENSEFPRRISIWTLDGKFTKALYGNCNYGGGGIVDAVDPTRAYVSQAFGVLQFRLDWKKGTSDLEAILELPDRRSLNAPSIAYHVPYNRVMGYALSHEGNRYLSSAYCTAAGGGSHCDRTITLWKIKKDGLPVPVASVGNAERWSLLQEPRFAKRWPKGVNPKGDVYSNFTQYAWADLNGDGKVDPEEVQMKTNPTWRGYAGIPEAVTLGEGFSIVDSRGNRYKPVRFTEGGAPVYDLETSDNIFPGARTSGTSGGGQVLDSGDGWAVHTCPPEGIPGWYVTGAKEGKFRWSYPVTSVGNHAGYVSPAPSKPGEMIAISSLAGPAFTPRGSKERLWPVVGLKGNVYVLTTDGMFVATLFKDYRQAKPGPVKAERDALLNDMSLGDDAWSTTLTKASDGNVYIVGGHDSTWVTRVDGLETVRRLPESEVVASEERQAAALNAGAVTPATHPRFPVEKLADGSKRFVYKADFQKDKKAVDAVSSGTFADRGVAETHTSGIYGEPTVFKFAVPGEIQTIEVTAVYFNSVDAAPHAYSIHYSFDGRQYKPLVEKSSAQPGDVKLDGKNEAPKDTRRVWVKFAGLANPRLTLKQVSVALTYRETR